LEPLLNDPDEAIQASALKAVSRVKAEALTASRATVAVPSPH
jgi:hypothetical protein